MARRAQAFSRDVLAKKWKLDWLGKSVNFIVLASLNTYSRQQENEADAEGLDILVRAGFSPQVALETFDHLQRYFRDQPAFTNLFYGVHPNYSDRRRHLSNLIHAHYRKAAGLPPVRRSNWRKGPPPVP
jgi:predicted Zn-dependent protease